jgi:putative tryptophan/tyrosine transport system substrate-binding protein
MRRREFIAGIAGAVAWPLTARAQQPDRIHQIGFLIPGEDTDSAIKGYASDFIQGLAELGWVDGRNVRVNLRFANRNADRMRTLARELVGQRPDVIVVSSGAATRAVQQATATIPIIFVAVGDPVAGELMRSISRPEGNTTGVTNLYLSLAGKWLQLLKEAAPRVARVAILHNPDISTQLAENYLSLMAVAASKVAVTLLKIPARNAADIERALEDFAAERYGGVVVLPPGRTVGERQVINALALKHQLPVIYPYRYNAIEGGLMAYGSDLAEQYRRGGPLYVDRILRGASVIDLPVQFPTKFELVINLKTAKAIKLDIPPLMVTLADEVIE